MLMLALTTSVGQTSGRCITQLATDEYCIDPEFIELTADLLRRYFPKENTGASLFLCGDTGRRS